MMTKTEIRVLVKERLKSVNRPLESAAILSHILSLVPEDGLVLAFEPLKDEPDISPLIEALRSTGRLALVAGPRDNPALDPPGRQISLALVPGRAFDTAGRRIGRGGGTFDRVLATIMAPKVGVAFDCQIFDHLPSNPHDVTMDRIVTAKGVFAII
jgi:5-formyltetrahydrofolate cyclo-ligase